MSKYEKISDNEWLVMDILWRDGKSKSSSISNELQSTKGWAGPTVRTFLKRLIAKNVAQSKQDKWNKRIFWYYPTVSKHDYINSQTKGHVKKYYDGNLPQMVAGLLKDENISQKEIAEIENILKNFKNKDRL